MYDNNEERVEVGGTYWHPSYASLVRVTGLMMRFDGVAADYEFVQPGSVGGWCFAGVLFSHNRLKAEQLRLLAEFEATTNALAAFAKLES